MRWPRATRRTGSARRGAPSCAWRPSGRCGGALRNSPAGNEKGMSGSAADLIPSRPSLPRLRDAAEGCRACHLWKGATQTVFGEGPARAPMMLVGEQPGDREDVEGHPFVGPAGRELSAGFDAAGIERSDAYITNVVKHFKYK